MNLAHQICLFGFLFILVFDVVFGRTAELTASLIFKTHLEEGSGLD